MDLPAPDNPLRDLLSLLVTAQPLSEAQSWQAFESIMSGRATDTQIGALLTALAMRPTGPTVDEITGAARAMRNHAMKIEPPPGVEVIDTCGTGGDGAATFNISTAAALIAAGAGATVAKHGNRSVTGRGSSQVLEALGVRVEATQDTMTRCLAEARICFCFAPTHHPAMKHAVAPRQQLGFRTLFNLLGPLTNPAGATRQLIGVYHPGLTETIAHVLIKLGTRRAMVVHGSPLDELTTTGPSRVTTLRDGRIHTREITPESLGLKTATLDDLRVNTVAESARVIRDVLTGQKGPPRDIAALNAAAALLVAGLAEDLPDALAAANRSLDEARARHALDLLIHLTNHP